MTPPNFIRKNGLIKGDLVVLSVWSLLPDAPLPLSETNCAAACARTPRCNAYSYCPDSDGCGSGCLQYTQEHPQSEPIAVLMSPSPSLPVADGTSQPVLTAVVLACHVLVPCAFKSLEGWPVSIVCATPTSSGHSSSILSKGVLCCPVLYCSARNHVNMATCTWCQLQHGCMGQPDDYRPLWTLGQHS